MNIYVITWHEFWENLSNPEGVICFDGRDVFQTTDLNKAKEYKIQLEDNAKDLGEEGEFKIHVLKEVE